MCLCIACPRLLLKEQSSLLAALAISPFISKRRCFMYSEVVTCKYDGYLQVCRSQLFSVDRPLNNMKYSYFSPGLFLLSLLTPTSPEVVEIVFHLFTRSFLLLLCPLMDNICFCLSRWTTFFVGATQAFLWLLSTHCGHLCFSLMISCSFGVLFSRFWFLAGIIDVITPPLTYKVYMASDWIQGQPSVSLSNCKWHSIFSWHRVSEGKGQPWRHPIWFLLHCPLYNNTEGSA